MGLKFRSDSSDVLPKEEQTKHQNNSLNRSWAYVFWAPAYTGQTRNPYGP